MNYAALMIATLACTQALASPLREAAPSLLEAAPDQEAFHEMLATAPKGDAAEQAAGDAERQAKARELRAQYEQGATDIQRASALFELIRLCQERAFFLRDRAIEVYLKEVDKAWIGERPTPPTLDLTAARDELLKRVNALRDMLGQFPNDPRRDELNWMIASTMARLGNEQSDVYFKQAIEHAKDADWSQKSRLSQADYLVSKGKLDPALKLYDEIRQKAEGSIKGYATYRLGWVYLVKGLTASAKDRLSLLKRAEAALKLVVVTTKEKDEDGRFKLASEAGSDLAWLWAYLGDEREPTVFFEKHDMPEKLAIFRDKLAAEAVNRRQYFKAATLYRGFVAAAPLDRRVPDYHLRLAQAFVVSNDAQGLQQELRALEELTTKEDNPWLEEHKGDAALIARVHKMRTLLPLTAGLKLLKAAESEKSDKRKRELLSGATRELSAYLRDPPPGADVRSLRATLASAYTAAAQYLDALDQLDHIMKLGPSGSGSSLDEVAYQRLNILVKLDTEANYPPVPELGTVKSPLPLPGLKVRFARAAEDYLRLVPHAEIEPNLRFQVAQDLFTYGHYDEALPRFEALAMEFPRTDQGKRAIELTLSLELKREHWDELVRLSTAFLNSHEVKGKALRDYIKQNLDYAKQKAQ